MESRPSCIYGLTDPRTNGEVRYVGKCAREHPRGRLYAHLREARSLAPSTTYKIKWLRRLLELGLEPGVVVLESGEWTLEQRNDAEISWIATLASPRLTNATVGGDGGYKHAGGHSRGPTTDAGRRAIAESNARRMLDPEWRERFVAKKRATAALQLEEMSARTRELWTQPEYRAAQEASNNPRGTGKPCSPEKREKIAESNRRTKQTRYPRVTKACVWCGDDFEVPWSKREQPSCCRQHGLLAAAARKKLGVVVVDVQRPVSVV